MYKDFYSFNYNYYNNAIYLLARTLPHQQPIAVKLSPMRTYKYGGDKIEIKQRSQRKLTSSENYCIVNNIVQTLNLKTQRLHFYCCESELHQ